ncbi:Lsr2 family DNA-binding protein [Paractinoplanes toevensis]|uniref:Lsr2 family DNA-binding protein n=1 Tax=Paractinoplanes toevensis TaxID=571911 RepID=UPI001BB38B67|nr:BRCT domain-containing protein [Actinoplanes toevensis]
MDSDRIIEIAVVTTDPRGRPGSEWTTVLDPDLSADAPRFPDLAGELSRLLAGRVIAGHQAAIGQRFLAAEFRRAQVEMPAVPILCTCDASRIHLPGLARRRLRDCYPAVGAGPLAEARAAAGLLRSFLAGPVHRQLPALAAAVRWPDIPSSRVKPRRRVIATEPAARGVLAALLDDLPLGDTLSSDLPVTAGSYLELVAQVTEDGALGEHTVEGLAEHGRAVGLSRDDLAELHRGFVPALARAAVVAGATTGPVQQALVAAAEALGVPTGGVKAILAEAGGDLSTTFGGGFRPLPHDWAYGEPLRAGQAVAFTGGEPYRRSRLELAAELAGLRVVNSVAARTAVLVSGHSRPRSTKGLAAQRAGIRIVTPKVFEQLAAHVQPAGPARTAVPAATVRAWANAHGHIVGPRGRLPRHVHEAFRAAHGRE